MKQTKRVKLIGPGKCNGQEWGKRRERIKIMPFAGGESECLAMTFTGQGTQAWQAWGDRMKLVPTC